ncbi:MAG TPA: hypothetical protein EYN86_00855 [Planctomycetes bacterium]|nr:hypothetical protein [Planctomycetota bacterium]
MQKTHSLPLVGLAVLVMLLGKFSLPSQDIQHPGKVILEKMIHLGNDATPEWPEAAAEPDAFQKYTFMFNDKIGATARALEFTARDADSTWTISINGKTVCVVKGAKEPTQFIVPIAKKVVRKGNNIFEISTPNGGDDITFGKVRLLDQGYRDIFNLRTVRFKCTDANNRPLACRISVVAKDGSRAAAHFTDGSPYPTRDGVVYTNLKGIAQIEIEAADYIITASHGPEFSIDQQQLKATSIGTYNLAFDLEHQVDTTGWLSADTHLHTLTHSGHGDASTDERILTLAGDHTEIAIATDHNKQIDYRQTLKKHGVKNEYKSIVGNEVSTKIGHFNAFPLPASGEIPDADLTNWAELDQDIRSKGAAVVILNHPRWSSFEKGPFGVEGLDQQTGTFASGIDLAVDAIELINSDDAGSPFDVSILDWFAILNSGKRIMAVGSSDSHAVYVPTSYGRTWVKSKTDIPSKATDKNISLNIGGGHSSAALGLFGEVYINGKGSGEDVRQGKSPLKLSCRIAHAAWADVYRVDVVVNGEVVHHQDIAPHLDTAFDETLEFELDVVDRDSWVVCIAYGKKPGGAWWVCDFPELYFASNPIFINK